MKDTKLISILLALLGVLGLGIAASPRPWLTILLPTIYLCIIGLIIMVVEASPDDGHPEDQKRPGPRAKEGE